MKIIQITTDNREHFRDYAAEHPYFGAAPDALFEGFEMLNDVELHVIGCIRQPVKSPAKLGRNIHFHSLVVPKSGWMSSGYYGCTKAVRSLCAEIEPSIVHGQGTERECAITAARCGFPNVLTIHGNVKELHRLKMFGKGLYGPLASFFETRAMKSSAGVFCNSHYTRELVKPRARHTWLVPNPIRKAFFQAKLDAAKPSVPTLVNVGVVSPRKRQLEILQMIGQIVKRGSQVHVVFAGSFSESSEYGAAFAAELRKAESAGYASFAGFLNSQSLIELLDRSHGFLHFPTEEAFGLVVAEAMARGLQFFGANLGGIKDIAAGIDGAVLHDDFTSLQQGITRWLEAGAPAPADAADEIARRYHPLVIAQKHLEIYQEVLAK